MDLMRIITRYSFFKNHSFLHSDAATAKQNSSYLPTTAHRLLSSRGSAEDKEICESVKDVGMQEWRYPSWSPASAGYQRARKKLVSDISCKNTWTLTWGTNALMNKVIFVFSPIYSRNEMTIEKKILLPSVLQSLWKRKKIKEIFMKRVGENTTTGFALTWRYKRNKLQ